MATLTIQKLSAKTWKHTPSDGLSYILTKFYVKSNGNKIRVCEFNGALRSEYLYSDVIVYDIGGTPETFVTIDSLMQRLEALDYTGFFNEGGVTPVSLISSDADNIIELGTDGKLYAKVSFPKAEKYLKNIEIYDLLGGYNVIGGVGNPNSVQYLNRTSFDYNLSAWKYETLASVGSVANTYHNYYDEIPTMYNVSDQKRGFYAILAIKLTNYSSTSQRKLFGLKWHNGAFGNINPSDFGTICFSFGRDAGDANLSLFVINHNGFLKIPTTIPYNIQEILIFEAERYTGGNIGYIKLTTSVTNQTFEYTMTDFRNNSPINLGVGINNAATTDVVGYTILINKMYYDL